MTRPDDSKRWPRWVYGQGEEPDYRFTFANERTYLAWIRTSLALLAAGVALDVVELSVKPSVQHALTLVFVGLSLFSAVAAWLRWAKSERAMRRAEPLPSHGFSALVTLVLVVTALLLAVSL
ncbi:YidH family protein [Aeromicrobium duanguangcaii]|uniref:DUF202 domain-containing protein n=1 Tax=Aeromicrobium duanguangcaii TaxID=2968086 RepID=A0ABY5KIT2_9ACTN|nr:DUF202 domain-containing protein [Aeromicrobium duanguangcaii]MCD9153134.1 DUF202 domain-containing protein [Aeromicrobium duanguangcaii]UUI69765.1 DUF202 domain-containing protein [Aeromicrobium duanguangcaii]